MNTTFHATPGSIQIVRGLLMSGLSLGMLGFVLSLLGMECTFIGGKDRSKHKKICAGGCCHITSGNVCLNRTISKTPVQNQTALVVTIGFVFILMCCLYLLIIVCFNILLCFLIRFAGCIWLCRLRPSRLSRKL